MNKTRMAAIERIQKEVGTSPLLILEQDKQLQTTLAGWKFIEFVEGSAPKAKSIDGLKISQLIDVAWDGVSFNLAQVESVLGDHYHPARSLKQAQRLGLGYPDGTIHPLAEQWITMKVQAMIQTRAKPKRKT